MKKILYLILIVVCLSLCSCSNGWQKTKNIYKKTVGVGTNYINTDPSIDLKDELSTSLGEQKLAHLFYPVDSKLQSLIRSLDAQDIYPDNWWMEEMDRKFSWINGLLIVTKEKEIVKEIPQTQIKQINPAVFFDQDVNWSKNELVSFVVQTPLGPEMLVARPIFEENQWQGILAVHFDPRTLAGLSPAPDELLFFQADSMLWPGKFNSKADILLQKKWDLLLKEKVAGDMQALGVRFYWLSRYIGRTRLIYAVPVSRG